MIAQTVTPMVLGLLLRLPSFGFDFLPLYALICIVISFVIFFFVKSVKGGTGAKAEAKGE